MDIEFCRLIFLYILMWLCGFSPLVFNVMDYINLFSAVETDLHTWSKFHFVVIHNSPYTLLDSILLTFVENLSKRHYYLLNSYICLTLLTPEFFKVIVRNHLWFISIPNIHSYSERLYCLRAGTISWTLPGPNLWQVISVSWMKGLLVQRLAQTWSSGHVYLWKGGCLLDYAFLQSRCWGRRRWIQGCWEVTPGTD